MKNLPILIEDIKNNKKSSLNLSNKDIGPKEMEEIARLLPTDTIIRKLDLSQNKLGPTGIQILCEALKNNKHLQELNVSANHIRAEGFKALGDLMNTNNTIKVLKRGMNYITPKETEIVGNGIQEGLRRNNYGGLFTKRIVRRREDQNQRLFLAIDTYNFELALNIINTQEINPNYVNKTSSGNERSILANAIVKLSDFNVLELQKIISKLVKNYKLDHSLGVRETTLLGFSNIVFQTLSLQNKDTDYVIKLIKKLMTKLSMNEDRQVQDDNKGDIEEAEKILSHTLIPKGSQKTRPSKKDRIVPQAKKLLVEKIPIKNSSKRRLMDDKSRGQLPFFGYSDWEEGKEEDQFRQQFTNERYFQVRSNKFKPGSRAEKFYHKIFKAITINKEEKNPVEVINISGRGFIIALTELLKNIQYLPTIEFKLGSTLIKCEKAEDVSRIYQRGNLRLSFYLAWKSKWIAYSYGEAMIKKMAEITDNFNDQLQQLLMHKIREKIRECTPFSIQDFNIRGIIKSPSETPFCGSEDMSLTGKINFKVNFLNFMILMTYFEIVRRLYRDRKTGRPYSYKGSLKEEAQALDQLPVGLLTSRASSLVEDGKASLTDLYGYSVDEYGPDRAKWLRAKYGPTTGQSLVKNYSYVTKKAENLNADYSKFLATLSPWAEFCEELEGKYTTPSSGFMREELDWQFGGGSESETTALGYSTEAEAALSSRKKAKSSGITNPIHSSHSAFFGHSLSSFSPASPLHMGSTTPPPALDKNISSKSKSRFLDQSHSSTISLEPHSSPSSFSSTLD